MAYILEDVAKDGGRREGDEAPSNSSIALRPLRSLFTALHGTSNSPPHSNDNPPHQQQQLQQQRMEQRGGAAFPTPPSQAGSMSRLHHNSPSSSGGSGGADDALYLRAVDYSDILRIIEAPTTPPTHRGFGFHTTPKDTSPPIPHAHPHPGQDGRGGGAAAAAGAGDPSAALGASPHPFHFRRVAEDEATGAEVYSSAVADLPVHMMRATVIMPCPPSALLEYMDNDVRPQWDTHIRESRILRPLRPPRAAAPSPGSALSQSLRATEGPLARATSLAAQHRDSDSGSGSGSGSGDTVAAESGAAVSAVDPTDALFPRSAQPFAFEPGQRRVALHYLGVKSPVPFVQDRDFELVVSEGVLSDGTAVMKAFSAPAGTAMPLDPAQTRYVRGLVMLSGVFARPLHLSPPSPDHRADTEALIRSLPPALVGVARQRLARAGSEPVVFSELEYFGLVHPMGMIPPQLVNMIITAQVSSLKKLQHFIATHSLPDVRPAPVAVPAWQLKRDAEKRLAAAEAAGETKTPRSPADSDREDDDGGAKQSGSSSDGSQSQEGVPKAERGRWWKRVRTAIRSKL